MICDLCTIRAMTPTTTTKGPSLADVRMIHCTDAIQEVWDASDHHWIKSRKMDTFRKGLVALLAGARSPDAIASIQLALVSGSIKQGDLINVYAGIDGARGYIRESVLVDARKEIRELVKLA